MSILLSLSLVVPLLIAIAFFTLAERKVMAAIQRRKGPNVVGFWGLLQPLADGLKLVLKEMIIPSSSNKYLFLFAPAITFILSFLNWALLPLDYDASITDFSYSLLLVFAISSFSVYGIVLAGWSSKSRYPFLGALRSAAQMISYEVSIGLVFIVVALCANSLNLIDIVHHQIQTTWLVVPLFPLSLIFFISILAETNRAPFDLPEAEAELVAGYNLEYSAITFALFFLGEYSNIILMSGLMVLLFFGGWEPLITFGACQTTWFGAWLAAKIVAICFLFILVRAAYPRYRYDQLMDIGWKIFFPINLMYLILISLVFFCFSNVSIDSLDKNAVISILNQDPTLFAPIPQSGINNFNFISFFSILEYLSR